MPRRKGHKDDCHCQNTQLGTKCKCQYSSHNQIYLAPDSTEECIVFEYDKANHKWKTPNYSSSQHKERASVDEIEGFLNEINEPLGAWSKQYGKLARGEGLYLYIAIFLIILLPLFFIYSCWLNAKQDKAKAKLEEVKRKIYAIVQMRRSYFSEKGLIWQLPKQFPQWIELWIDEEKKPLGEKQEMVGYEKSVYPKSPQGNKVVPIGEQQKLMYNTDLYSQSQEK